MDSDIRIPEMNKDYYCRIKSNSSIPNKKIPARQQESCNVPNKLDAFQCTSENMREREALWYLEEKKIYDIVDFLMGNLLLRRPNDPYEYLTQLLDKCVLSRDGLVNPPPPFSSRDIIKWAKKYNQVNSAKDQKEIK